MSYGMDTSFALKKILEEIGQLEEFKKSKVLNIINKQLEEELKWEEPKPKKKDYDNLVYGIDDNWDMR